MAMKEYSEKLPLPKFFESLESDSSIQSLPYSDFERLVSEDNIFTQTQRAIPGVLRLQFVSSLSLLSNFGKNRILYLTDPHSRFSHSSLVSLEGQQIARQSGFSEEDVKKVGISTAIHDIATPALGDATKKVDPEALDEELFWEEALDSKGEEFISRHGLNRDSLGRIIRNEGILGKVLDVSDRLSYVMQDLKVLFGPSLGVVSSYRNGASEILSLLTQNPHIGDIYKTIFADQRKEDVIFTDPKKLEVFLKLRAYLHRDFYFNPPNQGRDIFVAKMIQPLYSRNGESPLNPTRLRKMVDFQLLEVLSNRYAPDMDPNSLVWQIRNWYPKIERFGSEEEARKREQELKQHGNIAVVGIKECKGFDPATSYKVADGYKYVEFRDFDPKAARQIETIVDSTKGIFLFWADVLEDNPTNTLLRTVLKK